MRNGRASGTLVLWMLLVPGTVIGCRKDDAEAKGPPQPRVSVHSPAEAKQPDGTSTAPDPGEPGVVGHKANGATPDQPGRAESFPLGLHNPGPGWRSLVAYSHRVDSGSGWPGLRDIQVIDAASGRNWTVATNLELDDDFRWSPDGSMIAIAASDGVHVAARDGSGLQQVLRARSAGLVSWHPDGEHLIYARHPPGPHDPSGFDPGHMLMLHSLKSGKAEQVATGTLCAVTADARWLLYAQMTRDSVKDQKGSLISNARLVVRDLTSAEERSYIIPEAIMPDFHPYKVEVAFDRSAAVVSLMAEFGIGGYSLVPLSGSSGNWMARCFEQALAVDPRHISPDTPKGCLWADGLALAPNEKRIYWVVCEEGPMDAPLSAGAKCSIWSTALGTQPTELLVRRAPYLLGRLAISSDGKTLAYELVTTKGGEIATAGIQLVDTDGTNDRELVAEGGSPIWCPVRAEMG